MAFAEALRQVPPRQRVTLICRFYQGLDVAETAATLNCSEGTVRARRRAVSRRCARFSATPFQACWQLRRERHDGAA